MPIRNFQRLVCFLIMLLAGLSHAQTETRPTKAGDVHVYSGLLRATGVRYEETVTITSVDGDEIKTSHARSDRPAQSEGLYTRSWGSIRGGTSTLQLKPASKVLVHPLAVGKTWESSYEATTPSGIRVAILKNTKVIAQEKLATLAGEFETFKIEAVGFVTGLNVPGRWPVSQRAWYAPSIDRLIKIEYKEDRSGGSDYVIELREFRPAP